VRERSITRSFLRKRRINLFFLKGSLKNGLKGDSFMKGSLNRGGSWKNGLKGDSFMKGFFEQGSLKNGLKGDSFMKGSLNRGGS